MKHKVINPIWSVKKITRTILLLVTTLVLTSSSFGQSPAEEQAVKDVVIKFQKDFADGKYSDVASYTTEDWIHINPIGGVTNGRDAVLKEILPLHQTSLKGVSMTIESMTIRFLSPTSAVAIVVHKLDDYYFPPDVKHHNEEHMKTYIIVKKGKKWLLTLDQNDVIVKM